MTNPHLKTGVDSTPETLCEKHFRQWIPSNKFMLQIEHHCHKPFELHESPWQENQKSQDLWEDNRNVDKKTQNMVLSYGNEGFIISFLSLIYLDVNFCNFQQEQTCCVRYIWRVHGAWHWTITHKSWLPFNYCLQYISTLYYHTGQPLYLYTRATQLCHSFYVALRPQGAAH